MFKIKLRKLNDEQLGAWLKMVLPLVLGKDRREARRTLFTLGSDKYTEMKEQLAEKGACSMIATNMYGDLRKINRLILYTYFPYQPEYEPGVVPPKGGPYDMTLEERFYLDTMQGKVENGQLTTRVFEGNRKHVTVSVEGFDKPQKLKVKVIKNDRQPWLPHVFGYLVVDDVEYSFAPGENKLVYYSDEGKIDEGKPWRLVNKRPLAEWQLERRARTAEKRATQLTKAEKDFLDEQVLEAVRAYDQIYEGSTNATRLKHIAEYWSADGMGEPFEWPGEPSKAAKKARNRWGTFDHAIIRNSLNRLVRRELITKYSEGRGKPVQYWVRVPYDG